MIESQHLSNKQTLRGLEKVSQENEILKTQTRQLLLDKHSLELQLKEMQALMIEHSIKCPLLKQSHENMKVINVSPLNQTFISEDRQEVQDPLF